MSSTILFSSQYVTKTSDQKLISLIPLTKIGTVTLTSIKMSSSTLSFLSYKATSTSLQPSSLKTFRNQLSSLSSLERYTCSVLVSLSSSILIIPLSSITSLTFSIRRFSQTKTTFFRIDDHKFSIKIKTSYIFSLVSITSNGSLPSKRCS